MLSSLEEIGIVHDCTAFLRQFNLLQDLFLGQNDAVDKRHLFCGMKLHLGLSGSLEERFFVDGWLFLPRQVGNLVLQNLLGKLEVVRSHSLLRSYGINRLFYLLSSLLSRDV